VTTPEDPLRNINVCVRCGVRFDEDEAADERFVHTYDCLAAPPVEVGEDAALDDLLVHYFAARDAAIDAVLAHRASPPEYPGLALVPVVDLDRLAEVAKPTGIALRSTAPALDELGTVSLVDIDVAMVRWKDGIVRSETLGKKVYVALRSTAPALDVERLTDVLADWTITELDRLVEPEAARPYAAAIAREYAALEGTPG
jgi:hypothetical protein